ncbi:MAG: hypothetical protein P1V97_05955 [Planctomycetota bacterium]|nr:hypothetical protein [Planctomycetota bacterium]
MTKDAQGNSKKHVLVYLAVALTSALLILTFLLLNSRVALNKGEVTFSKDTERPGLNKMSIRAPYGSYVHFFDVVPYTSSTEPYTLSGHGGMGGSGRFLADFYETMDRSSKLNPSEGRFSNIELEKPFQIPGYQMASALQRLPKDRSILKKCGRYIFISKTRRDHVDFTAFIKELNRDYQASKKVK